MVQGGALEGVAAIAGLHVGTIFPQLPKGHFGTRKGTVMASVTAFTVTFRGKGTHGAYPHQGTDSLLAACQFGAGIQSVRYSAASPVQPTVISIGSIHAGAASNVLPEMAVLEGTMRTTTLADKAAMDKKLAAYAQGIALANGVSVAISDVLGAPITANTDFAMADLLAAAVTETYGAESFMWFDDPTLGGEDFGEYLMRVPGVFFFLGTNPDGSTAPHHHPKFNVADDVLYKTVPVVDALIRKWAALQ
jgi:amidohydrolase